MDDELIKYIWSLRNDSGIPIHFRRRTEGSNTIWYVWYGFMIIAYRASAKEANAAIDVASNVHHEIYKNLKLKNVA